LPNLSPRITAPVLGAPIDVLTWEQALARLGEWAVRRESRYVCICNAHSVVTARQDAAFARVIHDADMATPDGAPVAWMLRQQVPVSQQRINGPDLMWRYCEHAQAREESIFLYGGTPKTLAALQLQLQQAFPALRIAGAWSPPFRALTAEEDAADVGRINASGANTVWVSLGCPKQEFWMASHRGRVHAPMVGVGAAFDYHAGTLARAPVWMQNRGLEWLHRLISEPKRLWKRYLLTNTVFVVAALRQLTSLLLDRNKNC
jgi:N-acetylglucosaminyldiphosphoundecaprenol N-acetyl-beta-D-mannosaminyltransferase